MAVESGMPVTAQKPPVEYETYWGRMRPFVLVWAITMAFGVASHWNTFALAALGAEFIGACGGHWLARVIFAKRQHRQPFWSHLLVDTISVLPLPWIVSHQVEMTAILKRLFGM